MVTPRQFSTYDPTLIKLFEAAYEHPVNLTFPTALDAKRQRKQLYAFRDAIDYAKDAPPNLKVIAKLLSFQVKENVLVVYRPRHVKLEMKALEEARAQKARNG